MIHPIRQVALTSRERNGLCRAFFCCRFVQNRCTDIAMILLISQIKYRQYLS